uniref:ZF-HD dimerization-type domain-containing protein n=1 Tax=Ananas comosus var. bracteatus TaxID=296719 RepID=A0A6V7QGT3_ANACO|nr:unnamed protein product [Ananas comosus var. bracteatus]
MPGGAEGSLEALKCAACGCHRNFHRRDGGGDARRAQIAYGWDQRKPIAAAAPPFPAFLAPAPLPLPYHAIPRRRRRRRSTSTSTSTSTPRRTTPGTGAGRGRRRRPARGGGGRRGDRGVRKRFRTKFTQEQKEKMQAFAEKLGWRIKKHDDVALQQFCLEIGVDRHVLKVWMHNNKSHLASPSPSPSSPPTPLLLPLHPPPPRRRCRRRRQLRRRQLRRCRRLSSAHPSLKLQLSIEKDCDVFNNNY